MPELSAVILCYRTGDYARTMVREADAVLSAAAIDYELVLVANLPPSGAPPDPTPAVLHELADANPRIRVVSALKAGMMGWDMRSGLAAARGRTIAVIDGDGQMPATDLVRAYQTLHATGADLVKTYRTKRADGNLRRILSAVYNGLFHLLFPASRVWRDINSKPKLLTRAAYGQMHLQSTDWFTDAEIMLEAIRLRLAVAEIPTIFLKNPTRPSFVRLPMLFEFLRNLLRYRFCPPR